MVLRDPQSKHDARTQTKAHPNEEYVQCTIRVSSDAALISSSGGARLQVDELSRWHL
jgi:hypothetical protein